MILVFRLLSWAEKYQMPYPQFLALAAILAAGLLLALWIAWAHVGRDRTYSKH